jgi:hypothetical protein
LSRCQRGSLTRQVPWLALVQIHHSNHTRLQGATANFALQIVCNELLIGGMESKTRRHSCHGLPSWSVNNSCRVGGGLNSKTSLLFQRLPRLFYSISKLGPPLFFNDKVLQLGCSSSSSSSPLLVCLCVCLHTTDFCQTVFRTHFRHTSNHLLLLLRPLPPPQNPKHSWWIEETTAMRIETAKRETKSLALANTTRAIGDDVWQASETKPQSSKPLFSRTRELHIVVRDGAWA